VIHGRNAPLVASTVQGQAKDLRSCLVPKGTADIFFPTDFRLLADLYLLAQQQAVSGSTGNSASTVSFCKSAEFFRRYAADVSQTRTQSGYTPFLEDFTNTSTFLASANLQKLHRL